MDRINKNLNNLDLNNLDKLNTRVLALSAINYGESCPEVIFRKIKDALLDCHAENLIKKINYPVILIAGTNGKGSVAHGLSRCFGLDKNLIIGRFTSPHLHQFVERICVNEIPAEASVLLDFLLKLENIITRRQLNYFQISFLLALKYFEIKKVNFGIFEAGLGGKYDPVNLLDPMVSVITSISRDHMEILGDKLDQIASQKLGIARPYKPLFYADNTPQAVIIKNKITEEVYLWNRDFFYPSDWPEPKMLKENSAVVLAVFNYFKQLNFFKNFIIKEEVLKSLLLEITAPGRLIFKKFLNKNKNKIINLLVDVAHNEGSCQRLQEKVLNFRQEGLFTGRVLALFGAKKNKEVNKMQSVFINTVTHWEYIDLEDLENIKNNVQVGLEILLKQANENDLILCFGSFLLAGPVLEFFK